MPTYLYTCAQGHDTELVHRMGETVNVRCSVCGNTLRRRYTMPNVQKSGFIERSPAIKQFLDTTSQRRDKFEEKKAARHE